MSADLFAEFGNDSNASKTKQSPANGKPLPTAASNFDFFADIGKSPAPAHPFPSQQRPGVSANAIASTSTNDDNDDWGDFEGSSTVASASAANRDSFAIGTRHPPLQSSWASASTPTDPFSFEKNSKPQSFQSQWQSAPIVKAKASTDPSVLFDAEADFDDDDDFGDFEGTEDKEPRPIASKSPSALVDLMGASSLSQPKPASSSNRKSHDVAPASTNATNKPTKSPVGGFGNINKAGKSSAVTDSAASKDDDAWDTFDDWEASIPTSRPTKTAPKTTTSELTTSARNSKSNLAAFGAEVNDPQPGELPPTNVPPPGVLLSLFPTLFAEAQEKLFKPMAAQTLPMRNKLMAEAATVAYLQGYLMLANVAARIIAGRKLRWKRDQHLSQGMRIGPASSRATSGMKLTGIDKGENMKEEREVSDVVRVWKEQVGRLRHVVSGSNQIRAGTLGAVPDLHEAMPVKTLKQSEGGVPARQPCMLCGLKREERVTATDVATDDSFGEWWVDQVSMHRGCRNFWYQHKDTLRQR